MQSLKLRDSDKDGAARLTQVDSSGRGGTRRRFRHQVAANTKVASQPRSGDTSAALGHLRSDMTKSTYGHANMRKGRGVAPAKVTAVRPVKICAVAKVMSEARK
jgi:hypothetical protein